MVCVFSPSLWLNVRPVRFYKTTEGLSRTLGRAGYPYFYLFYDRAAYSRVREDIAASGFVAHPEKWKPSQVGEFLGFILNLIEGIIKD